MHLQEAPLLSPQTRRGPQGRIGHRIKWGNARDACKAGTGMEAAAEGAPLAETLHYWREGAHCISAWYSIIAPEKAGGNEAAANPRSSQRRGAANRPNGAWVASTPAGWRYPSAMPRELSPPKRFARCDTRDPERGTAGSLLSLSGSLLLLDGPPGPRFAVGARSNCAQPVCGASLSSSRSRKSRRRRASRRSLRANSTASVRLCSTSRAACRRLA